MKILGRSRNILLRGNVLVTTLILVAVMLAVFVSIYQWASSNARITVRNNQYNMSENAAEAAVERVIGQIDRDFIAGSIGTASTYAALPSTIDQSGWPVQYTYTSTNGTAGLADVIIGTQSSGPEPLNSQYAGLYGIDQPVDVYATATPGGQMYNVPATVHESLQYAKIPLFQFAVFYNVNMEIDPGAAMKITGPVFGNQSIWEGSSVCTFLSSVSAVGTNYPQASDPFATSYTGSGSPTFSGGIPRNNADSLVMPIGTNNSPGAVLGLLALPPASCTLGTPAAYSEVGQQYPANEADLVISNYVWGTNFGSLTPSGTNMIVYYQDNGLLPLAYDFYTLKTGGVTNSVSTSTSAGKDCVTNVLYAGFTWATNVGFYDWREGWNGGSGPAKQVQAVQLDMGLLNKWLTNQLVVNSGYSSDQAKVLHTGHHIGSVYVYTSVLPTASLLPAVRVTDGAALPNPGNSSNPYGFTVATPFPIYVKGDYNCQTYAGSSLGTTNTTYTVPAALMGDAVTILSDSWSDSNTGKLPAPSNTTVNAGLLCGIVQSNPNISGNYSGGVENFMRLLENWGGTLTYNGSIVVLFYSQYATNSWQPTGNYYNAPSRNWAFDMNFKNGKLPPLTPSSKAMIRGNWYAHQ